MRGLLHSDGLCKENGQKPPFWDELPQNNGIIQMTNILKRQFRLAGWSGNLAGWSGNLAGWLGNLAGWLGNLAGWSDDLAGWSGDLAGRSDDLAGRSGDLAGRSDDLAGWSGNLPERSGDLAGGSSNMRLRFDAPCAEHFVRTTRLRKADELLRSCAPESQRRGVVDGTRGACAPKNFKVSILKNGIQRVVYTSNNADSWRSLRLGG